MRKLEGEKSLETPRHRCKAIKMGVKEIGWESVDWINLALVGGKWRAFVNLWVP
jgi:hypothetical protein